MGVDWHSNSETRHGNVADQETGAETSATFKQLKEIHDRKNIFYYSFSTAPESPNPHGTVNLTKVAHTELYLDVEQQWMALGTDNFENYVCEVYGIGYNFLSMQNGIAALTYHSLSVRSTP